MDIKTEATVCRKLHCLNRAMINEPWGDSENQGSDQGNEIYKAVN